jgi:hypothetical protein
MTTRWGLRLPAPLFRGNFEIGRFLHLKSEISKSQIGLRITGNLAGPDKSNLKFRNFGFEMQESSDFEISPVHPIHGRTPHEKMGGHRPPLQAALFAICAAALIIPFAVLSHETTTTTVLFDREIVRILDQHCVMCHTDGGLSFPLSTYEQTWLRGRSIRASILRRHMPPWAAVSGYGQFLNDNSLTLREVQFLISWVEGLGPRNAGTVFLNVLDPNARPLEEVRAQAHVGHWQLGQPGQIILLPSSTAAAGQADHVRRVVIDPGLRSDRRIRAVEYMPGDRRVVRAAFFTVQETGQWIGSWTPWHGYTLLPESASRRLPARSHIVAEIHYRGAKEPVVEEGSLGLFFVDRPTANSVSDLVLEAKGEVPAGQTAQRFRAQTRLTAATSLLALRPEFSSGIQSLEVSARRPDGGTDVLLFARDIPIAWPTPYVFKEPVRLPGGTTLTVTAYYANSSVLPQPGGIKLTISRY